MTKNKKQEQLWFLPKGIKFQTWNNLFPTLKVDKTIEKDKNNNYKVEFKIYDKTNS